VYSRQRGLGVVYKSQHVFADAAAFDAHLEGADDRSAAAYELIAPEGFEIYGPTSPSALAMLRASAERGFALTIAPELPAGFLRTPG
jgi:hypothetical protein